MMVILMKEGEDNEKRKHEKGACISNPYKWVFQKYV